MIGVSRLYASEREQGGVDALLLAPVDRTALFLAKAGALLLFLVAVELVAVPAFAILLRLGPGRRRHARAARDPRAGQHRSGRGGGAGGRARGGDQTRGS